jgi:transcription-repair coupling factor (superfamily II helicase)
LQILQNLDYLGASFALASYDLEIRGAGNLLGEEQSGHIKEIGSDLYQKLLEQEIFHLKNNKSKNISTEYYNFSPNISLNLPVFIPKTYISDIEIIMEIYQKLGTVTSYEHIVAIKEEMLDRFGTIPNQVENLLKSIELKINAKKAFVEKIIFGKKGIQMDFYSQTFPKIDELINYAQANTDTIKLKPEGAIIINYEDTPDMQIRNCLKILEDLYKILQL